MEYLAICNLTEKMLIDVCRFFYDNFSDASKFATEITAFGRSESDGIFGISNTALIPNRQTWRDFERFTAKNGYMLHGVTNLDEEDTVRLCFQFLNTHTALFSVKQPFAYPYRKDNADFSEPLNMFVESLAIYLKEKYRDEDVFIGDFDEEGLEMLAAIGIK